MKKIFKFKTENELSKFDKEMGEYSGSVGSIWMYNEGRHNWFGIQYVNDYWSVTTFNGGIKRYNLYRPVKENYYIFSVVDEFDFQKWKKVTFFF